MDRATSLPDSLSVIFGQGGGFAGLWNGYTVQPDGLVLKWQGYVAENNAQAYGRLDTAGMQTLWHALSEADIMHAESQPIGNVTAYVRVTADTATHRVSWRPRPVGVEGATKLDTLMHKLDALVLGHKQEE